MIDYQFTCLEKAHDFRKINLLELIVLGRLSVLDPRKTNLFLRRRDFLDHYTGDGLPPSTSIRTSFLSRAISNIDRHSHNPLADSLTVSCHLSCFVYVAVCLAVVNVNVHKTVDCQRLTFRVIEGEKPAFAAVQTKRNSVDAIKLDF